MITMIRLAVALLCAFLLSDVDLASAQTPTFGCQWTHGGEPDLKEFKVSWGVTPGVHTSGSYTMPLAQYCLPPLWMTFPVPLPAGTYYFVVQAVDVAGNVSVKSPEVTLVVPNASPAGCQSLKVQIP